MRVPCQSCPVWAYREAKSRGRLLDMPLAACLTKNNQLDIFDGQGPSPGQWPSHSAAAAAAGTPQSEVSSPLPASTLAPSSPVPTALPQHTSVSWPQSAGALAAAATAPQGQQPQHPMQPLTQHVSSTGPVALEAVQSAMQQKTPTQMAMTAPAASSLAACLASSAPAMHRQLSLAADQQNQQQQQRLRLDSSCGTDGQQQQQQQPIAIPQQPSTARGPPSQAASPSQPSLQRQASQEVMDAVDSMDVAMLLETFGKPLEQVQQERRAEAAGAPNGNAAPAASNASLSLQQQQQQQQQIAQAASGGGGGGGWTTLAQHIQSQQQHGGAVAAVSAAAAIHPPLQQQHHQRQGSQQLQTSLSGVAASLSSPPGGGRPSTLQHAASVPIAAALPFAASSEPMAVPSHRQALRTMSGVSGMSHSGIACSSYNNTNETPLLGSAVSSNNALVQSLSDQLAGAGVQCPGGVQINVAPGMGPSINVGSMGTGAGMGVGMGIQGVQGMQGTQGMGVWNGADAAQLQQLQAMQQLQQQQQVVQQQQQQLLAMQQQQQQQAQAQLLQRSLTDDLPRTSPISIGGGAATLAAGANTMAAAAARRDAMLRAGLGMGMGMGLSDPGVRGLSAALGASPAQLPGGFTMPGGAPVSIPSMSSSSLLADNMSGLCMGAGGMGMGMGIHNQQQAAAGGMMGGFSGGAAASSFGAGPGSSSISPTNCTSAHTLAGAGCVVAMEHSSHALAQQQQQHLAGAMQPPQAPQPHPLHHQHLLLPGSAPSTMGGTSLAAAVSAGGASGIMGPPGMGGMGMVGPMGRTTSCELSEVQLMRMGSDGLDPLGPAHSSGLSAAFSGGSSLALSALTGDVAGGGGAGGGLTTAASAPSLDHHRDGHMGRYK